MSAPEAARFFLALSDPTRLALLAALREGERPVGELVDALGCPQPKVSRHLKVLKDAGLVRDRRDGRNVYYALATRRAWPAEARGWIERLDAGLLPDETAGGADVGAGAGPSPATGPAASPAGKNARRTAATPAPAPPPPAEMEDFLL